MDNRQERVILVTGGAGFLGRGVCSHLASRGYSIRTLSRKPDGQGALELDSLGVSVTTGDLLDKALPNIITEGVYGVIHLAGIVGKPSYLDSQYWQTHVTATKRLIEASRINGVKKFLLCSTTGIMGSIKEPPASEAWPINPRDIYDITKAQGEMTALAANGKGGMEVTVVRPAVAYGPGDMRRMWFFRSISSGKFTLPGKGENLVHPVYIDDLAEGIALAFESPTAAGKIYILGGEKYLKLKEWIELIAGQAGVGISYTRLPYYPLRAASIVCEKTFKLIGLEPPIYRRYADFFLKSRAYDISLAKEELAYAPKVGLEEGARRTLEWYKSKELI